MIPCAIPQAAIDGRSDCHVVSMGPPSGVSGNDVGTAEMLISPREMSIPGFPSKRQYAYFRPSKEEIEILQRGGFIEFCQYGNVVQPFSAEIWGAPEDSEIACDPNE